MPLFWFSWLPLLYFSGISSVPEYFQRRFGSRVGAWVTVFMLIYLIGYVGVNLFTMGTALNTLLGWPVWTAAIVVATISAVYVTFGGQTSVIMTDLFQGVMLLATGALIFWLGFNELGGVEAFGSIYLARIAEHSPTSTRILPFLVWEFIGKTVLRIAQCSIFRPRGHHEVSRGQRRSGRPQGDVRRSAHFDACGRLCSRFRRLGR